MKRRDFLKLMALTPFAGLLKPKPVERTILQGDTLPPQKLQWSDQRQSLGWKYMMTSKILNKDPIHILSATA